jgi:hypothetical protein
MANADKPAALVLSADEQADLASRISEAERTAPGRLPAPVVDLFSWLRHKLEVAPADPLGVALQKIAEGDPLTEAEEHLVDAHAPNLSAEDLTAGEEVDPAAFLAHLRGDEPRSA